MELFQRKKVRITFIYLHLPSSNLSLSTFRPAASMRWTQVLASVEISFLFLFSFWISQKCYSAILEPAWYSVSNYFVKFDSRASYKIMPHLVNFSGHSCDIHFPCRRKWEDPANDDGVWVGLCSRDVWSTAGLENWCHLSLVGSLWNHNAQQEGSMAIQWAWTSLQPPTSSG